MHPDNPIASLAEPKHDECEDGNKSSSEEYVVSSFYEDDGIHNGLEFPTEKEKNTLRRVSDSIPWNAYRECLSGACHVQSFTICLVIAIIELAERFSYYGSSVVFVSLWWSGSYLAFTVFFL